MTVDAKGADAKGAEAGRFETILYEEDGPIGWITLNRPDAGDMFTAVTCQEISDCIEGLRRETRTSVVVFKVAGDRIFKSAERRVGLGCFGQCQYQSSR